MWRSHGHCKNDLFWNSKLFNNWVIVVIPWKCLTNPRKNITNFVTVAEFYVSLFTFRRWRRLGRWKRVPIFAIGRPSIRMERWHWRWPRIHEKIEHTSHWMVFCAIFRAWPFDLWTGMVASDGALWHWNFNPTGMPRVVDKLLANF